jgi:hypothetical protein
LREIRNAHKILFGIPEGKILLRKRRCREEDDIKTDCNEFEMNQRERVWTDSSWSSSNDDTVFLGFGAV